MSPDGRAVIVKRTKLFTAIPGLLSLAAACSSSGPTCGDAGASKDCLAVGDRNAGEATGSIQMQPAAAGDPPEIAPLQIVGPQVVRGAQRVQQPNTALMRGETSYSIVRRYGTSVAEVANSNIIKRPAPIKSNATIIIPVLIPALDTTPPV